MNKYMVTFFILVSFVMQATIIESEDIRTILHHIYDTHHHNEILVVFDIDNTVGHIEGCGGDEWFTATLKEKILKGDPIHIALAETLSVYFILQNKLWLEPVQAETPKMIRFLQDVGIAVMALTSRSLPIKERTLKQLEHMHIHFERSSLHTEPLDLTREQKDHLVAYYEKGILFSAENNKGDLLLHFFDTINYHPKKVIFIDDKIKYVEQVDHAMKKANIPYVGIRYSRLDEKVKNFNLKSYSADKQ